jgi:hypothetical protein
MSSPQYAEAWGRLDAKTRRPQNPWVSPRRSRAWPTIPAAVSALVSLLLAAALLGPRFLPPIGAAGGSPDPSSTPSVYPADSWQPDISGSPDISTLQELEAGGLLDSPVPYQP